MNHPRSCLRTWRDEADYLEGLVAQSAQLGYEEGPGKVLMARAWALRQCAQELDNRLTWSGLT